MIDGALLHSMVFKALRRPKAERGRLTPRRAISLRRRGGASTPRRRLGDALGTP